jgi:pimeloyl-ACP methyl ester carboxylesterase
MRDILSACVRRRSRRVALRALLVLVLIGGCAPTFHLRSENTVPELKTMLDGAAASDPRTDLVAVDAGDGQALYVALRGYGPRSAPRVIYEIHGVMSDGTMWRYLPADLAADYRVIAVDLPGCGDSDAPDPRKLGPDAYSPPWLSRCILQALRTHLARTAPAERITLVGHSLGGMLILRMLSDSNLRAEFADVLDRVDNVVLFTPIDVAVEKEQPLFKMLRELTDAQIVLADAMGILPSQVAESIHDSVVDPAMATEEEAARVLATLRDPRRRRAMQAMVGRAVPRKGGRPDWEKIEELVSRYAQIRERCLIVWGGRDELFPESMGHRLVNLLPDSRLRIIVAAKHCLPTEHPQVAVHFIQAFVAGAGGGIGPDKVVYFDPPTQRHPAIAALEAFPPRKRSPEQVSMGE